MRRADAEREADRRNRDDPEAERYEFYAYDESAGLAEDAWEVGARLRGDPSSAPSTYAGAGRRRRRAARAGPAPDAEPTATRAPPPPPPSEGVAAVPELYAEPPPETWLEDEPAPPAPATGRRDRRGGREAGRRRARASAAGTIRQRAGASAAGRWVERRREVRSARAAASDRPGLFARSVAGAVIVLGMLWMGMVVALAVILKPDDLTGVGLYLGAAVLGLLAIALGAAIRRS